jgi:hypothetical protein
LQCHWLNGGQDTTEPTRSAENRPVAFGLKSTTPALGIAVVRWCISILGARRINSAVFCWSFSAYQLGPPFKIGAAASSRKNAYQPSVG